MPPRDLGLVLLVILAWGSNFSAMKLGLQELPPFLFVALRFAILVPFIFLVPRPASWLAILGVGLFINTGQFAFLFSALEADVTAGLASLIIQSQAPLTILLAAIFYKETVAPIQIAGIALASVGLGLFGLAGGGNVTLVGLGLVLCGALSWALGNMILRRLPGVKMLPLFLWASLVPPLPMLGLSLWTETDDPWGAIAALTWGGWAAVLYVALISTVIGYSIWGALMSRHKAALVTPFALLIPVIGIATAAVVLGEAVSRGEALAAGVILAGLALAVLGPRVLRPR